MKKLAALLLLLGASLALAACGYPVKPENNGTPDAAVTTVKPDSGYTLGGADVVVADGFAGNVLLKGIEGTALFMSSMVKDMFRSRYFIYQSAFDWCLYQYNILRGICQ